ncbi:hypothetical protein QTQ03_01170 [Micromonospora sp. WMMA1363]|uniref:hypothetical protein n=1 Tax=Micromonospora sp. WMMA1363 TaxID=3053985 RepID=UPI00259D006C|nr:hypothetical protein [Micromonospora sp. WMMA1363]MDM4718260.1 hypothetical protein [Micromonospora sp. WMMA1363]
MGVNTLLATAATRSAHVLVVEAPGWWMTRAAVERQVLARGWCLARSPADADVLAVCGPPGPELVLVAARLWDQLPGPRCRVDIRSPDVVSAALEAATVDLCDQARQRNDSRDRPGGGPGGTQHGGVGHGHMDMAPDGVPLAGGEPDRDGLELDVLHVRLGPVLPYWPAGLVLRCSLHGDLLAEVAASVVDATVRPPAAGDERPRRFAARRCDNASSLLALAGWEDAACHARRLRDALLGDDGGDPADPVVELGRFRRRIRRSWLLRWSLRRLGQLTAGELTRRQLPAHLRGDARDRLLTMLDRAGAVLAGAGRPDAGPAIPLPAIADLVRGWDIATARLIVASLDLEPPTADRTPSHA